MAGRGKTVLVVEDQPLVRAAMRELLQRMGLEMIEAADGSSAVGKLSCSAPALICLDLTLPDSSGYELCELIRRSPQHRATPLLIMSERCYPADRAHAAEVGADAFIIKPFRWDDLRRRITELLDRDGERGERPRLAGAAEP